MISVDLHAPQVQGYFNRPLDHLMALPILADYVQRKYGEEDIAVVSPDAGRIRVAEQWSKRLGGVNLAFIHKTRDTSRPNQAVAKRVIGDVAGKTCILVDDMIDTAGTIVQASDALIANGAASVVIATTHPILSDPATERLKSSQVREVVCTNTLPVPPEKQFDRLTQLSIAPLLARAIRAVFDDGSVTSLFDGEV
jgi:ribose-phosphate pyrophosphokinase